MTFYPTPQDIAEGDQERAADEIARPQVEKIHKQFQRGLITLQEFTMECAVIWKDTR